MWLCMVNPVPCLLLKVPALAALLTLIRGCHSHQDSYGLLLLGASLIWGASLVAQTVKNLCAMQETCV